LLVVLNGFNEADAAGQLRRFHEELMFADLEIISNRIAKLKDQLKKPRPQKQKDQDQAELDLLERIATGFENNQTPRSLGLKEEEEKLIRSFQLLTLKPELVLLNVGDNQLGKPVPADLAALAPTALQAPAKLELELAELPTEDREVMMAEYGLKQTERDTALQAIFSSMGLQVFFTVGDDECRAWSMPQGGDAVIGASQIHTDLGRTFVRAEVVAYDDFKRVGSMKDAKQQGVYRLEGKTYVVKDGDIMHILAGK
jgi:ribosome-binding ATPase YchF (GTP1/OBG family)